MNSPQACMFPQAYLTIESINECCHDLDLIMSNLSQCAQEIRRANGGHPILEKHRFVSNATKGHLSQNESVNKWRSFIKSLRMFSTIREDDLESEMSSLSELIHHDREEWDKPDAPPPKCYEQMQLDDDKMYVVIELKSALNYLLKFNLHTWKKQREQLIALGAGLRYLAWEYSPLDYISACLDELILTHVEVPLRQMSRLLSFQA